MITKKVKTKVKLNNNNNNNLQNLLNAANNLTNAMEITTNRLNAKYNKRVKFNLELMAERAVDAFYESYTPNMYSRQEGLYKAYKVIANNDDWSIDTENGAQYMETDYDAGKEYVFANSFLGGWHGGAIDGPDHPEPGTPWWRAYGEWYKRAARGPSPERLLEAAGVQEYIDDQEDEYSQEWEKIIEPYYNKFMEACAKFFGR